MDTGFDFLNTNHYYLHMQADANYRNSRQNNPPATAPSPGNAAPRYAGFVMTAAMHVVAGWALLQHTPVRQQLVETVRKWKFVPARRGSQAIGAWMLVPILFNLRS